MHSVSEENYIKAIYHAQQNSSLVSTNEISARMNTRASSVTDMLKKLADKNLAEYVPYHGSRLTAAGMDCAMKIIRKHRLWEVFLVEKLNFSWDEVHEVAEQLEHIQSPKLIDELDKHLGFPKEDPHGDPIPDKNGKLEQKAKTTLSQLKSGDSGTLVGVGNSSTEFLKYLNKNNLELGTRVEVIAHEDFDGSQTIKANHNTFQISKKISENLYLTQHHEN
ncbi:MAG: metal-dependent transcriptional regulator [Nonlabens sp.]